MLSQVRTAQTSMPICAPAPDDRWHRDMKEDMKAAMDLLWKFKEGLDKLHPECTHMLERMLANPNRSF